MPEVLYLSRGDVEGLGLPMGEVVAAVEEGFRLKGAGETEMPPKPALHPGGGAFIHAMPALVRGEVGLAALKWVAVYNTNPARGLPALAALLVLSDAADGQPLAVMDAALLTALRTGASVGVAARRLARDDVETVGVVGCGVQARTSLAALVEVLPRLAEVRCYDVSATASRAFVDEMRARFPALGLPDLRPADGGLPRGGRRGERDLDGDGGATAARRRPPRGRRPGGRARLRRGLDGGRDGRLRPPGVRRRRAGPRDGGPGDLPRRAAAGEARGPGRRRRRQGAGPSRRRASASSPSTSASPSTT